VNAAEHADFIFVNGNIHTVNERQRHAEAVAVKGQRIVFARSNEDAKRRSSFTPRFLAREDFPTKAGTPSEPSRASTR
jgi:hypothetical protein